MLQDFDPHAPEVQALVAEGGANFAVWFQSAVEKQSLPLVVEALLTSGLASSQLDALEILKNLVSKVTPDGVTRLTDFTDSSAYLYRLKAKLRPGEIGFDSLHRRFGVLTHNAMNDLCRGYLPVPGSNLEQVPAQGSLFGSDYGTNGSASSQTEERFERDIVPTWLSATAGYLRGDTWQDRLSLTSEACGELRVLLEPVFGRFMRPLDEQTSPWGRYLASVTLICWAAAVLEFLTKGPRIWFPEIQVLNSVFGLSMGRVDGLLVQSIEGQQPYHHPKSDLFRQLMQRRYPSVGWLLFTLESVFGPEVEVEIRDWKAAVGDFDHPEDFLAPEHSVTLAHRRQMQRYITFGNLDYSLNRGGTGETAWSNPRMSSGRLVCLRPDDLPVETEVAMSSEDQLVHVLDLLNYSWNPAQLRRYLRMANNVVLRAALSALSGRKTYFVPRDKKVLQPELIARPVFETATVIERVFSQHRRYVDDYRIVEDTFLPGEGEGIDEITLSRKFRFRLHYDKLLLALSQGQVNTTGFRPEKGGMIACLFPEHTEKTPSFSVSLERGSFKCFGCGAWGKIAEESISSDLVPLVQFSSHGSFRAQHRHLSGVKVPDECHEIMLCAQEILQKAFPKSFGESYLVEERGLDPGLAREYGVGWGDKRLVVGLLDSGYTFEQLVQYGFVFLGRRSSYRENLLPIFRSRGYEYGRITQERQNFVSKKLEVFVPYSVLQNRVTFPLGFGGRLTNFYGRVALPCAKSYWHRKLSVKDVPQGGFNMQVLEQPCEEVVMVEGTIDCLSLVQLGFPHTVGVIGTTNYPILEEVARKARNVALGFDNDIAPPGNVGAGQQATDRIASWLKARSYKGTVRDLTRFVLETDRFGLGDTYWKDWNKLLVLLRAQKT